LLFGGKMMIRKFIGAGMVDGQLEKRLDDQFCVNSLTFGFFIPPAHNWLEMGDGDIVSFDLNPLGESRQMTQVRIYQEEALIAQFNLGAEEFF
jgi:hypothetical protein